MTTADRYQPRKKFTRADLKALLEAADRRRELEVIASGICPGCGAKLSRVHIENKTRCDECTLPLRKVSL